MILNTNIWNHGLILNESFMQKRKFISSEKVTKYDEISKKILMLLGKVQIFWEGHKNLAQTSLSFWITK